MLCRGRRWKSSITCELDGRMAEGHGEETEIDYVTQMEHEQEIIDGCTDLRSVLCIPLILPLASYPNPHLQPQFNYVNPYKTSLKFNPEPL